jgi:hypothetical protein
VSVKYRGSWVGLSDNVRVRAYHHKSQGGGAPTDGSGRYETSPGLAGAATRSHSPTIRDPLCKAPCGLERRGTAGNLTTVAQPGVLAMARGYILYSTDADFGRFAVNPCNEDGL